MNFNLALLLLITMVWGTTFPLLKSAATTLSGLEISAVRFAVAAVCMAPFIWKVPRRTWIDGALLGALALVSYVAQAYGLQFISSNRSAFLTSLAVLIAPVGLAMTWNRGCCILWRNTGSRSADSGKKRGDGCFA